MIIFYSPDLFIDLYFITEFFDAQTNLFTQSEF